MLRLGRNSNAIQHRAKRESDPIRKVSELGSCALPIRPRAAVNCAASDITNSTSSRTDCRSCKFYSPSLRATLTRCRHEGPTQDTMLNRNLPFGAADRARAHLYHDHFIVLVENANPPSVPFTGLPAPARPRSRPSSPIRPAQAASYNKFPVQPSPAPSRRTISSANITIHSRSLTNSDSRKVYRTKYLPWTNWADQETAICSNDRFALHLLTHFIACLRLPAEISALIVSHLPESTGFKRVLSYSGT